MSGLVIDEATERSVALRGALAERIVIADGAMGTMLQAYDLTAEDFDGHEGCNEVLNVTRPDVVRAVHRAYLAAGADCVTTNTFGANFGNLSEYGIPGAHRRAVAGGRGGSPARSRTSSPPPTGAPAGCSARSARAPSCPPSATSRSASCATPTTRTRPACCAAAPTR